MLLTVEGGGFFSSSASGYSKGLALLLLGQKAEDKPMKVTPWNHCPTNPLEERRQQRGSEAEIQLAPPPENKGLVRGGCTSFSCFGCAAAGLESPSAAGKAGPTKNQETLRETPSAYDLEGQGQTHSVSPVHDNVVGSDGEKIAIVKSDLKESINGGPADSCPDGLTGDVIEDNVDGNRETLGHGLHQRLKKAESENSVLDAENGEGRRNINENGTLSEKDGNDSACLVERRKVQWMDSIGGELFEIREFEMSDDSDDEFGHGNGKCMCVIM